MLVKMIFALGWAVDGYKQLLKLNESFLLVIRDISRRITAQCISLGSDRTDCCKLRKDVLSYLQEYFI